ncbi:MAG: cell wall-binding repeat-containing protein [Euzebya sp.]
MTARMRPAVIAILVSLIAALVAATPLASRADAAAHSTFAQAEGTRIGGEDAIATAIALSQTAAASDTVVLARVDDYADALTGSVLAAQLGAPILFTATDALSEGVLEAIQARGATAVVILGGVAAVSQGVEDSLTGAGLTTSRVAGDNRFGTALAVAARVLGEATPDTVFFVEGENADPSRGWPDAITIAATAAHLGQPILPVNAEFVPPAIQAQWDAWAAEGAEGFIVGGTAAVGEAVDAALAGLDEDGEPNDSLSRLAGGTRFATSVEVYDYSISEALMDPAQRYVIPGGSFVEGLAAGAVAGAQGNPTIMVDSVDPANSPDSIALVGSAVDLLESYVLVGGESAISSAVADAVAAAVAQTAPDAATCLTLLHHNDGESQLLGSGADDAFGSLARLVTLTEQEQAAASANGCTPVTVTSGDNFLAGPELSASDPQGGTGPVLDAIGLSLMDYDAVAIGNHDVDFGPDFLARFIGSFDPPVPFLSANLDVSAVPSLQALADQGLIAPRITIDAGGSDVGIIGLTTPTLRSISSPGDIVVQQQIVSIVQDQIDALAAEGVEQVILISHLQGLPADVDLIGQLSGVDAVVAGGGDEVLADPGDPLVPGDLSAVEASYPLLLTDADGRTVPTVTTAGDYKYLGRLTLYFGADGELLGDTPFDEGTSRQLRLADESLPGGVARDSRVVEQVEGPVNDFVADLASDVIGTSEVDLDGARPNIRQMETNLGDLVADAHAFTVATRGEEFGIDTSAPIVGLQNGGGIRNNSVIPAGDITELTTFDILPFSNFIAAVPDFTAAQLKDVLEQAYAGVENASGAFAHVSNLIIEVDLSQTAQVAGSGDSDEVTITTPGERVRSVTLADGTPLITDGEVVADAPTFTLASIDFSLRNGDNYPFNLGDDGFTVVGTSYQQSLSGFIQAPADQGGLAGLISAADYPETAAGNRITITGTPS